MIGFILAFIIAVLYTRSNLKKAKARERKEDKDNERYNDNRTRGSTFGIFDSFKGYIKYKLYLKTEKQRVFVQIVIGAVTIFMTMFITLMVVSVFRDFFASLIVLLIAYAVLILIYVRFIYKVNSIKNKLFSDEEGY